MLKGLFKIDDSLDIGKIIYTRLWTFVAGAQAKCYVAMDLHNI